MTGTAWWLLSDLPPLVGAEAATARIEIIRTALAAGAGIGGAITLMLAFRRQRHQEIATASTEHDAAERRVTELYTKAVEQLGNAQAPVRLGGLYALERLAQNTLDHRQTIVDVICAYLRMPYTPPRQERQEKIRAAQRAYRASASAHSSTVASNRDAHEEKQVRLTAQRILTDHLRNPPPPTRRWWRKAPAPDVRFWSGTHLDLTGATLLDFDFANCRVDAARFNEATFHGEAKFHRATFHGEARFDEATFHGEAKFDRATFHSDVRFRKAAFHDMATFYTATFHTYAKFNRASFYGRALFEFSIIIGGDTSLGPIPDDISDVLVAASLSGGIQFEGATFHNDAKFDYLKGGRWVDLGGAFFVEGAGNGVWPDGWHLEPGPAGRSMLRQDPPAVVLSEAGELTH